MVIMLLCVVLGQLATYTPAARHRCHYQAQNLLAGLLCQLHTHEMAAAGDQLGMARVSYVISLAFLPVTWQY